MVSRGSGRASTTVGTRVTMAPSTAFVVSTLNTIAAFGTRWLVVSVVFTTIGVGRFLYLVRRKADADSPTDAMLKDPPFLASVGAWALCVLLVLYFT